MTCSWQSLSGALLALDSVPDDKVDESGEFLGETKQNKNQGSSEVRVKSVLWVGSSP